MSHFYGKVWGRVTSVATRCGHKATGMVTQAASWNGAIETVLWYDEETKRDRFAVRQIPWHGQGVRQIIASGVVGDEWKESDNG